MEEQKQTFLFFYFIYSKMSPDDLAQHRCSECFQSLLSVFDTVGKCAERWVQRQYICQM